MSDGPCQPPRSLLRRWGGFVARHAGVVVACWLAFGIVALAAAAGLLGAPSLFSRLHTGQITSPGEDAEGRALLERGGSTGLGTSILLLEGVDLADPATADASRAAARDLARVPDVASVASPYVVPGGPSGAAAAGLIGEGGPSSGRFATVVTFERTTSDRERAAQREADRVFDRLAVDTHATSSQRGGTRTLVDRIVGQINTDLTTGEGISLPISFLVMVVVFGGLVAAGMPVVGAVASIAGALLSLLGFAHVLELDATVVNVVTMLGLGLCIDYGLLVVSRFREEARAVLGERPPASLTRDEAREVTERTLDRAGRTIVFSALTVAIALAGLAVFDIEFVRAVSAAGVSVVLVALAVAVSLIPALCTLAATRLLRRGMETSGDTGVFASLAHAVQRAPWAVIVAVTAVLVGLALPALSLRLTTSGAEMLPRGTVERTFSETVERDYPALAGADVAVVTTAPLAEVRAWSASAGSLPHVTRVDPPRQLDDGVVVVALHTPGSDTADPARALTDELRTHRTPFPAKVVGPASGLVDFHDAVVARAPWAVGLVCLATLVLLFLLTGSVVVPVKALVMNVLSLGAALGALVWVFQWGHLDTVLGFSSVGGIENAIPLLVLAFGFGLSMDYEVFLLSRVVELHEQGHDTRSAVTLGLQRSGRIITSAALLMVIVFAGLVLAKLLILKQMGLALVLAVVIDATLVRMLLVPATMAVLGRANWWAPPALRRLHQRWGVSE